MPRTATSPAVGDRLAAAGRRFASPAVKTAIRRRMAELLGLVLVLHLADAQTLFRLEGPSGVRLKLRDLHRARQVADVHTARNGPRCHDRPPRRCSSRDCRSRSTSLSLARAVAMK